MAATYPGAIADFNRRKDNLDKVVAVDVNVLYDEVEEIERQLSGINNPSYGGSIASSLPWSSGRTFNTERTDWYAFGGLNGRIQNIENGLFKTVTAIDGGVEL